jgi:hypothetical protein
VASCELGGLAGGGDKALAQQTNLFFCKAYECDSQQRCGESVLV